MKAIMREKEPASCLQAGPEGYAPLLNQIGNHFGFTIAESKELAKAVFEDNGPDLYKLELVRRMVYQCVHKISSRMFGESIPATSFFEAGIPVYHPRSMQLSKMPLSFRTVYILFHVTGFSENEIAYILNIDPLQVKERLVKAATRITRH